MPSFRHLFGERLETKRSQRMLSMLRIFKPIQQTRSKRKPYETRNHGNCSSVTGECENCNRKSFSSTENAVLRDLFVLLGVESVRVKVVCSRHVCSLEISVNGSSQSFHRKDLKLLRLQWTKCLFVL